MEPNYTKTQYFQLVKSLYEEYGSELSYLSSKLAEFSDIVHKNVDTGMQDSTGGSDCNFLYLLIRKFKPKVIVEIGTWIGSTCFSMAQAVRKNGVGKIVTIDIKNACQIPSEYDDIIEYNPNTYSSVVLDRMIKAGEQIDLMFNDGMVDEFGMKLINQLFHVNSIFVTHDYVPPFDKGNDAVIEFMEHYKYIKSCNILAPPIDVNWKMSKNSDVVNQCMIVNGSGINSGCGSVIPRSLWNNTEQDEVRHPVRFYSRLSNDGLVSVDLDILNFERIEDFHFNGLSFYLGSPTYTRKKMSEIPHNKMLSKVPNHFNYTKLKEVASYKELSSMKESFLINEKGAILNVNMNQSDTKDHRILVCSDYLLENGETLSLMNGYLKYTDS